MTSVGNIVVADSSTMQRPTMHCKCCCCSCGGGQTVQTSHPIEMNTRAMPTWPMVVYSFEQMKVVNAMPPMSFMTLQLPSVQQPLSTATQLIPVLVGADGRVSIHPQYAMANL